MQAGHDLDLLLINPGGRQRIYQGLGNELTAKEPPIWGGLLATHARRRGLSVDLLDANALDLAPPEAASQAIARRPLLIVVLVYGHNPNASTFAMPGACDIVDEIKRQDPARRVLLLGGHVAALPDRTLRETTADFICGGEGPVTIAELVAALRASPARPELGRVRGLWWRQDGRRVQNPPAPLVTALRDEMPGMAWDLLPMSRYRAHNWHCFGGRPRKTYAALSPSLGCPFTCTFCCIQAPFKSGEAAAGLDPSRNSYRTFDPGDVVDQIAWLVEHHGVANVKIADELFLLRRDHVRRICDGLIGLGADLNLWAYARIDTCRDQELLEHMREAGVRWLALGIESASERVRADVDKGYRPEAIAAAIGRVRAAGIHVMANYIFGLPEDDHATMRQTLDFAKELNTEFANFFAAMAYPGSQLHREALERGWPLPDSWDGYSQHSRSCLPLPTRRLSGPEVLAFRDAAFQEYFDRDDYRGLIERTFGADTVLEIERMRAVALPRAHAPAPLAAPACGR